MGGQGAYATGTSAGDGLRHQPFLAPEVCIIVGARVVEWRGGDPCGRPVRFVSNIIQGYRWRTPPYHRRGGSGGEERRGPLRSPCKVRQRSPSKVRQQYHT